MIKESEAQKQRPHEHLWMLWIDEKSISNVYCSSLIVAEIQGGWKENLHMKVHTLISGTNLLKVTPILALWKCDFPWDFLRLVVV